MNNKKQLPHILGVILSCAISVSLSGQIVDNGDIHYEPTWESLSQHSTPEWYEDAVLGIYFHWGVYSVAEMGEWYAQRMYCVNMPKNAHYKIFAGLV